MAKRVRVVDSEGAQLGIMSIEEALKAAHDRGLDLVEVAPKADPPVCKIMDYGKFKYQQSKKIQDAKKKQASVQIKEIKLKPRIEEHDLQFKLKSIKKFLSCGNKVKISMIFKGREIIYSEMGRKILERIEGEVAEMGSVEVKPRLEGRNLVMLIGAKGGRSA